MVIAKRCRVSGRVQGVFYRASTQQQARSLGVTGHAKNLPDGCVEVVAVGEAEQVETLVKWLWRGSTASHVIAVEVESIEIAIPPAQFETA